MHRHAGENDGPDRESLERGFDARQTRIAGLVWFVVIFVSVLAVIHVAVWYTFKSVAAIERGDSAEVSPVAGAPEWRGAGLQPSLSHNALPWEDLRALRRADRARLEGYGWVDRKAGVGHIPIEAAMELILQRGLPKAAAGSGAAARSATAESAGSVGQSDGRRP